MAGLDPAIHRATRGIDCSMDAWVKPAHDAFPYNCEMLRVACNNNLHACLRQTNTTGKSTKACPSLLLKIFRSRRRANQ